MKNKKKTTPSKILSKSEKPVVRVENAKSRSQVVIVCDHASNLVPKSLKNLGLSKANLQKHVAWDPGTENIGLFLSKMLDAPAVIGGYSRLVIDLNRGAKSPDIIREVYDGIHVPGNKGLTKDQKKQRFDEFFHPYHKVVKAQIDKVVKRRQVPAIVSIHSFTPQMNGVKRPWHIGILWSRDGRISRQLVKNLRKNNPKLVIGENEPYSLKDRKLGKNTISTHAESKRRPYVIVEIRQDLIGTKARAEKWAKILYESLAPILADPKTFTLYKR